MFSLFPFFLCAHSRLYSYHYLALTVSRQPRPNLLNFSFVSDIVFIGRLPSPIIIYLSCACALTNTCSVTTIVNAGPEFPYFPKQGHVVEELTRVRPCRLIGPHITCSRYDGHLSRRSTMPVKRFVKDVALSEIVRASSVVVTFTLRLLLQLL